MKKRDSVMDMLRGIAALNVVAIHTAAWSGVSYVPPWCLSFLLVVDVPFFFVISGFCAGYHCGSLTHTFRNIGKIFLQWCLFSTLAWMLCRFVLGDWKNETVYHLFSTLFFQISLNQLIGISWSLWFMPVFIQVSVLCQGVLLLINWYSDAHQLSPKPFYITTAGLILVAYLCVSAKSPLFADIPATPLFYALFWLIGMIIYQYNLQFRSLSSVLVSVLIALGGMAFTARMQQIDLIYLYRYKFPPHLPYLFFSLISVAVMLYIRGKHPAASPRLLTHVGRNALCYFFAQGIGGSILMKLVPLVHIDVWPLKWVLMFLINLSITIICAEALSLLYRVLESRLPRLWRGVFPKVLSAILPPEE